MIKVKTERKGNSIINGEKEVRNRIHYATKKKGVEYKVEKKKRLG